MYLIGVAIIAVLSPLFALTVLLPVIVGLRFLQGVGFSGSSTSASAMSADLIPASRRAEGIGYYSLANTVGMAIGPDLGLRALRPLRPDLAVRRQHRHRGAGLRAGPLPPLRTDPPATHPHRRTLDSSPGRHRPHRG